MKIEYATHGNLCGKDHLGRKLPEAEEVPSPEKDRIVALFYYLWLGQHGTEGPYNISEMLKKDPDALAHPESPLWPNPDHVPMLHWGEPLFGYYQSEDEWVLRRHVQMFVDAGVDVLFFDTTNGYSYRPVYMKLFRIMEELKAKGFDVPKVAFYLAPARRGCGTSTLTDLWQDLYSHRYFQDLYFIWQGKPLIVCHDDRPMKKEIRDFFTFRKPCWCTPELPDHWYWLGYPEPRVSHDVHGNPEEIPVSVSCPHYVDPKHPGHGCSQAYWDDAPMCSRSCHDGKIDTRPNASHYGFFFQEQIDKAVKSDARVAFVTQFNEWLVPFLTRKTNTLYGMEHDILLVDEYDQENSRDLEPMKDGFRDAYYLQMISFIRRFKGLERPASAHECASVDPASPDWKTQWKKISPVYREMTGDTAPRLYPGYDACGIYENRTGRNEFAELRVAADEKNISFYAETTGDITLPEGTNWMNLFLKISPDAKKTWEGFDFRINAERSKNKVSVERSRGGWDWEKCGDADFAFSGNALTFRIPRHVFGIPEGKNFSLEFKWSDNMLEHDVMDFYVNGDASPRGRLNYLFEFKKA